MPYPRRASVPLNVSSATTVTGNSIFARTASTLCFITGVFEHPFRVRNSMRGAAVGVRAACPGTFFGVTELPVQAESMRMAAAKATDLVLVSD